MGGGGAEDTLGWQTACIASMKAHSGLLRNQACGSGLQALVVENRRQEEYWAHGPASLA